MTIDQLREIISRDDPAELVAADTNEITVPSSDGTRVYTVRFAGSPEWMNPLVNTWTCDCPAGQNRRACKHVRAASDAVAMITDLCGQE